LGHAYQFLNDVADVVAGVAEVGKERGKDAGKCTAIDLFGVEGARRKASEFQSRSLSHLDRFGAEADWLRQLVTEASWKASSSATSSGSVPVGWLFALSEIFSTLASAFRRSASQWAFRASPRS